MTTVTTRTTQLVGRLVEGVEVPKPGTFAIDASHTTVGFVARHLMVAKVRGRFTDFSGSITIADDPLASSAALTIQAASITTSDDTRDGHLRSADFLDAEKYPTLTYRSTGIVGHRGSSYKLAGELTIREVTRPVTLEVELEGVVGDPWGNSRAVFTAAAEIDREEFGITWNQALETGGVLVGKRVKIEIEAEAVLQA
jgi:polyisoprenoid-binding protein YceI